MKAQVWSISINGGGASPSIAVFTTDGTKQGDGVKLYPITVRWLPVLLKAIADVSRVRKCHTQQWGTWFNWTIGGLYEGMAAKQARNRAVQGG